MKTILILIIIQEKNIEHYQLHGSYTKKDHNSNGNGHGLNTILKQMTNQGSDSKKE